MTEANWQIDIKKRETCATCKYFKRVEDETDAIPIGVCRRFPPQTTSDMDLAVFPIVTESRWCGEYKRFNA